MSNNQIDQVRAALRREAQAIEPVGLGTETVQRRGRRRHNRGRAAIAVGAAACVAGVGASVVRRDAGRHVVTIGAQSGAGATTTPELAFRSVSGTVGFASHFTTSGGVTYALSTAPGSNGQSTQPGQAIYRTSDGEHWTVADQGQPWITDLTERAGVLYAVGTAPGTAGDVRYHVGTSSDGGKEWSDTDLPFVDEAPNANVALQRSASVQVARGPSSTVALLTEQFWPNLDAIVAERAGGRQNISTNQTADGFALVDLSACASVKKALGQDQPGAADAAKVRLEGECSDPPEIGTIRWSEIGLSGPGDLARQQMLVSTDGKHWDTAAAPTTEFVRDLVGDNNGFLLLTEGDRSALVSANGAPATGTKLLRSTDARNWTNVTTPPGLDVQAVAGQHVIGVDSATGGVQTSNDGGATWHATAANAQLPAGAPNASASSVDAGPLGFAALVLSDVSPKTQADVHYYLLFSSDGITWKTTDLGAVGQPANAYPMQVTVGADHIAVDFEGPTPSSNGAMKVTTLLGTPKR